MGEPTVTNPLGLPLGQDNSPHQLRLTRLEGMEAARRTNLCTLVLDYLSENQGEGIFFFNSLHQQDQVAAILIVEEGGTHTQVDAFIQAHVENRHAALFTSEYRSENAEIVFQEMRLGIITNFISYRASLGGTERLGPVTGPGPAGAAGGVATTGREPAGQYPPEFLARRMQSDDMKNAKTFLQYGPLSAATIETFDQWREDLMRAARSVNLTEPAHWATINRLIETCLEHNIYQTVVDLIPEGCHEIEALDPNDLLDRIEARLITSNQLELKRIEFEVAKQKDGESL